jgi:GNAT superfamily N-acetyltransferase
VVTNGKEQTYPTGQIYTFARHETFHLRDGWLFKGLEAVQADECALYAHDAHHNLGIGLNMLKSLVYWLQATNLVQAVPAKGTSRSPLRPTRLAELVCAHDPYFEDLGACP